jgi:hypothetical protein
MTDIKQIKLQKSSTSSSALELGISQATLLRIQLLSGSLREVTQPLIGRDFVAGLLEDGLTSGFIRKEAISSIEFSVQSRSSIRLVWTRRTLGEQLREISFPTSALVQFRDFSSKPQRLQLIGCIRGFLVLDYPNKPTVPIKAVSLLELSC